MPSAHPKPAARPGFTLTELLVALAILAVIAVFAIPKVLQGQQEVQRKAVFREALATVAEIAYQGSLTGAIPRNGISCDYRAYFAQRVNALKFCDVASSDGCWDSAVQGGIGNEHNEVGFVLPNGAVVVGLNSAQCAANGWGIDWNGVKGPNQEGEDQMFLTICAYGPCGSASRKPGTIGPASSAPSIALFHEIFSN